MFRYYYHIPQNTRNSYDVDDMIADVVLHVAKQASKYRPGRAKESTWVWRVAEWKCLEILSHFSCKKYAGTLFELDLATESERAKQINARFSQQLSTASSERQSEAINALERMIESSSDCVLDLIEKLLEGRVVKPPKEVVQEFRETARSCSATVEDFRLVLQYVL